MRRFRSLAIKRGSAAVEFALIMPFLVVMLTGITDIGYAAYETLQAQHAAEAGAQYAALHGWDAAAITSVIGAATPATGITAAPAPSQFCGCPTSTGVTVAACSDACPGGGTASHYGRVSASILHSTMLPYGVLPSPLTLTGEATVRLQ